VSEHAGLSQLRDDDDDDDDEDNDDDNEDDDDDDKDDGDDKVFVAEYVCKNACATTGMSDASCVTLIDAKLYVFAGRCSRRPPPPLAAAADAGTALAFARFFDSF
jgi:hypothetical protein